MFNMAATDTVFQHHHQTPSSPSLLSPKIRIGVSVGALFKMGQAELLQKIDGFDHSQKQFKNNASLPFPKGPAFPFLSKMVGLNTDQNTFVELKILSRLTAWTQERVRNSLRYYGLTRGMRRLRSSHEDKKDPILDGERFDLILSTRPQDVQTAIAHGISAAYVDPSFVPAGQEHDDLRVAVDFDRCTALSCAPPEHPECFIDADEYTQAHGLDAIWERETAFGHLPSHAGPIAPFVIKICTLRDYLNESNGSSNIFLDVVTARSNGCLKRVGTTLEAWNCKPNSLHSTGNDSKGSVINHLQADSFFDDSPKHIQDTREKSPRTVTGQTIWDPRFTKQVLAPHL